MATHEVGHVVRLDARNDGKNYTSCPCSAKNLRNIKEE